MAKTNRQYEIRQELSEEQRQELQERLNKRIEQSKYFGTSKCPGRIKLENGRADEEYECKYAGKIDCGMPSVNRIHYKDPEQDVVICLLKTRKRKGI